MLAVIETGGKQYLVKDGTPLTIEKIEGEQGSEVTFDKVLLLAKEDGSDVKVGTPYLEGVAIKADLTAQGRARKVMVIKYKPKIRYKRTRGHRQQETKVRIKTV
jgi:large subunit ribosomal protein L21